ncbi:MAG: nitroreductase [Actinomyces sp.]|uniref:nitroreductase n=1 Tax=Actinomyces sp. TaxID=29317 RepID=UPI0026DCCF2C|nr:nitroreductase [Actinomyces sp.]MDO4242343.1 nitroreductase [Actinomyces sp.]
MNPSGFSELAASRHSVRDFLPDPVPQEVVEAIVDDARQAPSWSNTRPFMLALATGERADRLRAAYLQAFDKTLGVQHKERGATAKMVLSGATPDGDYKIWGNYPADLRPHSIAVAKALYGHLGIDRRDREARDAHNRRNCEAFGAPVIGFVLIHSGLMPFAALDAGLMLQTLFLSAKARGIDSCPIGILAGWRGPLDSEFDVPRDYRLITGFALGYASDAPVNEFRAERRPIRLVPPR